MTILTPEGMTLRFEECLGETEVYMSQLRLLCHGSTVILPAVIFLLDCIFSDIHLLYIYCTTVGSHLDYYSSSTQVNEAHDGQDFFNRWCQIVFTSSLNTSTVEASL